MDMTFWQLAGWAWLVMAIVMLALWFVQTRSLNAGTVDVAWAFGTGAVGAWLALGGQGESVDRQLLIAAMSLFWGCRLGWFLYRRVSNEVEDGRYRYLRTYLGDKAQLFHFAFYQVQGAWTLLFAAPMWAAALAPGEGLGAHDALGLAIWVIAMGGEALADGQLARFKSNPANAGQVCDVGLWRWSRHPNYFFEWLHWFAYLAIGWHSPYWWLCLCGPVVMYVFITKITGVPYTEDQNLRSKGDAYRRYQDTTSVFFPWPPSRLVDARPDQS